MVTPVPPPPVPPSPTPIPVVVRPYAPPAADWDAGHRGVDLAASGPVRSLTTGTVAFAGEVGGVPVVTVALGDGRRVTYQPVRAWVRPGQAVVSGQVLGQPARRGGHCGTVAGCVHVGLRADARYWDPTVLLGRLPAVLKPD